MNFYKRFPGDIQRKTGHLTPAEMGIYDRLLDWYYANERPLPAELHRCWSIAGAVLPDDQKAVGKVLEEFFAQTTEGWAQARTEEVIAEAQPRIQAARENGKLGGRPKKAKKPTGLPEETRPPAKQESQTADLAKASQNQNQNGSSTKNPPNPPRGERVRKGAAPTSNGFMRFWQEYPDISRKAARLQCWQKWHAKGLEPIADQIVEHVRQMKASKAWMKDGGEFIPAPLTYLNQQRFEAPTEAQAAKAAEETNWRENWKTIAAMGRKLGVGDWSVEMWEQGKAPDILAYTRKVEEAYAAKHGNTEDEPA